MRITTHFNYGNEVFSMYQDTKGTNIIALFLHIYLTTYNISHIKAILVSFYTGTKTDY